MILKHRSYLKLVLWACAGLCVLSLTILILQQPERVSERLMRLGGRIIMKATSNTGGVAIFGGLSVITLWLGIATVVFREQDQDEKNSA